MKHDCPYCGVSLKGRWIPRLPLPGERKVLPRYACKACPSCGGWIAVVHQPWDKTWRNWFWAFYFAVCIFNSYFTWSNLPNSLIYRRILWNSSLVIMILYWIFYYKYHPVNKNAPKYRTVPEEELKPGRFSDYEGLRVASPNFKK